MDIVKASIFFGFLLLLLMITQGVKSEELGFINGGVITSSVQGQKDFCNKNPEECMEAGRRTILKWNDVKEDIIEGNEFVNAHIIAEEEEGLADEWKINLEAFSYGDCEDYVLTKIYAFRMYANIPQSAMRIGVAKITNEVYHAVLILRTDEGDAILDNLTDEIIFVKDSDYNFVYINDENDPMIWRMTDINSLPKNPNFN